MLGSYAYFQWSWVQNYLGMLAFAIGPGMLVLATIGIKGLLDEGATPLVALLGPTASYLALFCLYPEARHRYLLPVFPVLCVVSAVGYKALTMVGREGRILASFLILVTALWWVADYRFSPNQCRYYAPSVAYAADYDAMKQMATSMHTIKPGVILGYSTRLDSGIEAVYYHELPFVWGRGGLRLFGREVVDKLVHDFRISYIWTDDDLVGKLREWFPRARVVMSNPPFRLLDVTPDENRPGDSLRSPSNRGVFQDRNV